MRIKLLLPLLLLISTPLFAQSDPWITDSLSIYTDRMEDAFDEENVNELIALQSYVYVKGTKSLDQAYYDFLYSLAEDARIKQYPLLLGKVRHNIGNLEFYRSRMDAAKNNFLLALPAYVEAGAKGDAAGMAMNLGIILERSGKYDSAILSYKKAMPIFLDVGDTSAVAVCLENIGLAYRYKGEVKRGLKYLDQTDSLLALTTPTDNIRWSYLYYNYSQMHTLLGDYENALEYALKGLRISESQKDERQTNIGYVELQDIYKKIGDDENWLKYVKKAMVFAEQTGNGMRLANLKYSLASFYIEKDNFDSASFYLDQGLAYFKEHDETEGLGRGNMIDGNIKFAKGQYQAAIDAYTVALEEFNPTGIQVSRAYHSLGTSYMRLGRHGLAHDYLKKALEMRLTTGQTTAISNTYKALAENSELSGKYEQAYNYHVAYHTYQDSVFNENKSKQISELALQYETEKKDQEILALEQDNEIKNLQAAKRNNQIYLSLGGLTIVVLLAAFFFYRSRTKQKANELLMDKNARIARQNAEKEDLLKEIHHRVKNNLQIISSLLNMQSRGMVDNDAIDAMKESQSRVKTMALIHEKLYQYDNLSRINMPEYLKQLSDFLAQTYRTGKDIDVVIETDDISLDIDTAVPLGLITNELLSNAWKYAFQDSEQGEIRISLKRIEDRYCLEILDSGKGIPEDVDLAKSKSLGLKLVRSLTRQIHGDLHILEKSPGAAFRVEFQDLGMVA